MFATESLLLVVTLLAAAGEDGVTLEPAPPRFSVEVPKVVLTDVPVSRVRITALNPDGSVDRTYNRRTLIRGLRLAVPRSVDEKGRIRSAGMRRDAELPPFRDGVLELTTDLSKRRKVFVTDSEIVVDPEGRRPARRTVYRIQRWFSIVPPLLAIVLALWLRNIIVALFAGVYSGAVILAHGDFFMGFIGTLDTYILGEIAPVAEGQVDYSHLMILFFTMFLGAMVGVMSESGGTQAVVAQLARVTKNRERGQLMTWATGLVVFFDDYANTLLVGSTMRAITDRLRISREKLAFLVDSTAAPVAGLAFVSTWVGVEISYISTTYRELPGMGSNVFDVFLATIPYRFYPIQLLVFVWLIAYTGHDYGPMLKAEKRAISEGSLSRPGTVTSEYEQAEPGTKGRRELMRTALVPLASLLLIVTLGLWFTGLEELNEANRAATARGEAAQPRTFWNIIGNASSERVLFIASFVASITAIAMAALTRSLRVPEAMDAWARGAKSMFYPLLVLLLAWAVARVCNPQHLNTAGFLVELTDGRLSVAWMPTLAFLLSAVVAFATGSSWSTMALLMPLFISVTYYLLLGRNDVDPMHRLMLATIGAILAGAIFGDHCSPISDTTVLSSAATRCDHLDHVGTQLPYACSVAGVALGLGYLPVGLGYSPIILLPLGLVAMFVIVYFFGRPAEQTAGEKAAAPGAAFDGDLPETDAAGEFPLPEERPS